MKQFTIICCFLSLFIPSMETAIACDNEKENCKGVESKKEDSLKPESINLQREIVVKLFKITEDEANNKIDHKYNYYGDSCGYHLPGDEKKQCVYHGGHAGWDIRTRKAGDIEAPLPVKIPFYSLTNGIVILDGRNGLPKDDTPGEKKYNTIAIYDEDARKTTFYLHASDVHDSIVKGKEVKIGDPLGWQGDTGSPGAFHVHLEVQQGIAERASAGTKDAGTLTIDPIPYLHGSIQNIRITNLSPASNDFDDVQKIKIEVKQWQRFSITARSDEGIKSISFVVSGHEETQHLGICRRFCRSGHFAVEYRFSAANEYTVVATITSETGKIVTRKWIVTVQRNPGAPTLAKPQVTTLLANYPNPFNPETWIPYHLATAGDVQIRISDVRGNVVRSLALGHQTVGHYTSQSRAAYWDGRNELGEPVASGVYFYTLTVGDFSATRKLLILK